MQKLCSELSTFDHLYSLVTIPTGFIIKLLKFLLWEKAVCSEKCQTMVCSCVIVIEWQSHQVSCRFCDIKPTIVPSINYTVTTM